MPIPKTIRVGPHTYRVRSSQKHWDRLIASDAQWDGYSGLSKHQPCEIWLNPDQSASQMQDTLLHEALHALYACSNLAGLEEPAEENVVGHLTPWLLMLLRANPALTEYLLAEPARKAEIDA